MSLGSRATTRGGAKVGREGRQEKSKPNDRTQSKDPKNKQQDKGKGAEKPQPKEKVKPQATTEQLRMAHMIDRNSDDPSDVRRMVLELMEMTCRPEEEVCSALHDADNDMQAACDLLLEETSRIQGEWKTSGEKKKKKPPAGVPNGEPEPTPRDARSRSGPRPRRGMGESRGRGRGRGGRMPRPRRNDHNDIRPTPGNNNGGDSFPATDDWDNEEWSGSLSDTKVFTPSVNPQPAVEQDTSTHAQNNAVEDWDTPEQPQQPAGDNLVPTYTYHNTNHTVSNDVVLQQPRVTSTGSLLNIGSTALTAAQSHYLSQLTQQTQRHDNSVYTSNFGVYGATDVNAQRKPQRARVPPPSKIPSMAVEMPMGSDSSGMFDVQFGALEQDVLHDEQSSIQPETQPVTSHESPVENNSYTSTNSMLNENLPQTHSEPPVVSQSTTDNNPTAITTALDSQLTSSMKQMKVSANEPSIEPTVTARAMPSATTHSHRPKQPSTAAPSATPATQPQVYHPTLYHSVYAPQVTSSTASLSGSAMTNAYPTSGNLTQYQPVINSYQVQPTSTVGAAAYSSGLYTAAPYYQHSHKTAKDTTQYETSVASSNTITSTSTSQSSTAKVTTTVPSTTSSSAGNYAAVQTQQPMYGQTQSYAYDDPHLLRHHMGGYYEVGYGVSGREGTFGLSSNERFTRNDAASPQQVAAALPPGYAYFYQPPPTTYQYGVYPTAYGTGSNVGGVSGVSAAAKVSYTQQQPYEQQDTYKQGATAYNASASKAPTGASTTELGNNMYAKAHVALNKVNSYEKSGFVGGTPPPFGASHHLYIPAPPINHHNQHHHLMHQMDVRVNNNQTRRQETGGNTNTGANRGGAPNKNYSQSYWPSN